MRSRLMENRASETTDGFAPSVSAHVMAVIHFSVCVTFSTTAGFAPLLVFVRKAHWLFWLAAISLLISIAYGRLFVDPANERPLTARETVVVMFGSVSDASLMGALLFLLYGIVWFVGWLLSLFSVSRGWVSIVSPILIATVGGVFALGVASLAAQKLQKLIFPTVGIGNAPLLPDIDPGQISPRAFFATAGLLVLISLSIFVSSYFLVLAQIYLALTSLLASSRLRRRNVSGRNATLRSAVKTMLRSLGYVVVERLQTGELKLDRLISVFDIIAHSGGYALALQLKTEEEGTSLVGWMDANYLKSATRPIYIAFKNIGTPVHSVVPMILLCGRSSDETLTEFAEEELIIVGKTDWTTIENIAGDKLTDEKIRELAQFQLKIRPADNSAEVAV